MSLFSGKIFAEFNEAEISFAPTHKFQPGLAKYVPGRVPSYTVSYQTLKSLLCVKEEKCSNKVTHLS